MTRKTLGYTKLEWTCPRCKSRNPGPQKTCLSCGAPQPKDIQFEEAESQKIIQAQADIEQAKKSADIHCAFCGTRNPVDATVCEQCGADLKEGVKRETGQVVGAFTTAPAKQIPCPNCKAPNPDTALKCSNCGATLAKTEKPAAPAILAPSSRKPNYLIFVIIGVIVIAILCLLINTIKRGSRSEGVTGTVQEVSWLTSVPVEAYQSSSHSTWLDEIPNEASIENCTLRYHHTQDQPAENSQEICGTPYSVDQGQGYAEVVQDCQYEVYQEYCQFSVMEWQQIDVLQLQGVDFSPRLPSVQLASNQRLGEEEVSYTIIFDSIKGQYTYATDDFNYYQQFQPGSQWILNINGFDQLISIEPTQ
jgi:ribosomal protein L40E